MCPAGAAGPTTRPTCLRVTCRPKPKTRGHANAAVRALSQAYLRQLPGIQQTIPLIVQRAPLLRAQLLQSLEHGGDQHLRSTKHKGKAKVKEKSSSVTCHRHISP